MSKKNLNINEMLHEASILHREGRLEEAACLFKKALDRSPDWPQVMNALAAVFMDMGDLKDAERYLKEALAISPGNPSAIYNLARVRQVQGRQKEAEALYTDVIKMDASLCGAWNNLGSLMLEQGKVNKALTYLEKAVECAPSMAMAWNNLGVAMEKAGLLEKAENSFRKAVTLDGHYASALFNLGALLHGEGRFDEASEFLRQALVLDPENVSASFLLKTIDCSDMPDAAPAEYVRRLFNDAANEFDSTLRGKLGYQTPEVMFKMAEPFLGQDLSILDLGCGTGLGADLYKPFASSLAGVDLSENMLKVARGKGIYDELFCFDIGKSWPLEKSFDIIYSSDVFVYFGRLSILFEQIVLHLSDDGLVIFSVEKCDRTTEDGFILGPGGRYKHSMPLVEKEVRDNGLKVVCSATEVIRKEAGVPVNGMIFILKKQEKIL